MRFFHFWHTKALLFLLICGLVTGLVLTMTSCSTPSARQVMADRLSGQRARSAAYAAEGFTMDHRSPEGRPYQSWEFYYKHCALINRNQFPSRDEYECSDPF